MEKWITKFKPTKRNLPRHERGDEVIVCGKQFVGWQVLVDPANRGGRRNEDIASFSMPRSIQRRETESLGVEVQT